MPEDPNFTFYCSINRPLVSIEIEDTRKAFEHFLLDPTREQSSLQELAR